MCKERSGISELLEIVFHYILFTKKIYPENIFEKRIRCNLPIWKCKHPAVCSYISNFFVFLEKMLGDEPQLDVAFLVVGKSNEILEEFVFEIQYPKELAKGKSGYTCAVRAENNEKICTFNSKTTSKFKLEDLLSSIALALNSVSSSKSNTQGCTFQLQVRSNCCKVTLKDIEEDVKNKKFPWTAIENPLPEPWSKMVPLQTVDNSKFKVQIYQFHKDTGLIDIG